MADDEVFDPGLEGAYGIRGADDARALYAKWAATYESGFITSNEYVYHRALAAVFAARAAAGTEPVLDVGCGTGLVGVALRDAGVDLIDGIDISPEMLSEAVDKTDDDGRSIYRALIEADLTGALELESAVYRGMVSAGTFTHGHVGPDALGELLRVAAPGCVFALGVNMAVYEANGFADRFAAEHDAGVISDFELTDIPIYDTTEGEHADDRALVAVFAKAT